MLNPPTPPIVRSDSDYSLTMPNNRNCMDRYSAAAKRNKFLKRLVKFRLMDFQFAFWQMIYLLISPQKVFRDFQYRKQTKNQWARDDPAFLVLLSLFLLFSSIAFGLVLNLHAIGILKFVSWVIFVDCISVGLLIATLYWYIANRFLLKNPKQGLDVEWAYCFDIHLNAFFPLLVILHVLQLPLLMTIINKDWYISTLIGNTFWVCAIGYYVYILFLGFSSLPFLKNTQVLLYPFTLLIILYIITIAINLNLSHMLMNVYVYRVGTS